MILGGKRCCALNEENVVVMLLEEMMEVNDKVKIQLENKTEIKLRGIHAGAKYELVRLAEEKNKSLNQFLVEHLESLAYTEEMVLREEKVTLALQQVAHELNETRRITNEYNENILTLISILLDVEGDE